MSRDLVTVPRRLMRCDYAHVEISEHELERLVTLWAESYELIDFEPSKVHFYQDSKGKSFVHFYGPSQFPNDTLFKED